MITENQWETVIALIASGMNNKDASTGAGITQETFYKKKREDSEFSDLVEKAYVNFKLKHLRNIAKSGNEGQWTASAWILERKWKREFGRVEMTSEIPDKYAEKTDEELNKMLLELEQEEAKENES